MRVARVFPRRTKATPVDELAFTEPPGLFPPEVDAVQISVAFTWDLPKADILARAWKNIAPVEIGGPAVGKPSGDFVAGRYLAEGYTITSRGCPRKCWFCRVPKVEGAIRELPIVAGWNVLDDNLLACSREHFAAVCQMLGKQSRRAEFTGGLDYRLLSDWHVDQMAAIHPLPSVFLACDPGDELEGLRSAAKRLLDAGWTMASHRMRCYVLVGYDGDSFAAAEQRLRDVLDCGLTPMAMLWRNSQGLVSDEWRRFQRLWARPGLIHRKAGMQ